MTPTTRRAFLQRTTVGMAAAGALAAVPVFATKIITGPDGGAAAAGGAAAGPLVAHVKDLASGEISLLIGTREVIHRDRALAARLYSAARAQGAR